MTMAPVCRVHLALSALPGQQSYLDDMLWRQLHIEMQCVMPRQHETGCSLYCIKQMSVRSLQWLQGKAAAQVTSQIAISQAGSR